MNRRDFLAAAAASPFLLRATAWAATGPVALVTADTEAHVAAVSLADGRILTRLATLAAPRSIETIGGRGAVVAHTTEGAVSILDTDPLRVRRVLRNFDEPRYTAVRKDARFAYVTDSRRGDVAVLDLARGRVVGRTELGGPARHVTLSPDGTALWVALGSKAAEFAVIDVSRPTRPRLVRRIAPPYLAHDVGFDPLGDRAFVTSGDRGTIGVYDARTLRLLRRLPANAPPQHVTFRDGHAFVTSGDDASLHVHRLRDGALVRSTRVPVGSYNVQQGFGRILTPSLERGTLCILDGSGRVVRTVRVAASSHDACFVAAA